MSFKSKKPLLSKRTSKFGGPNIALGEGNRDDTAWMASGKRNDVSMPVTEISF